MGRQRKPTILHLISGSAAKDPKRMQKRAGEPQIDGPDLRGRVAPKHLDKVHSDLWNELQSHLHTGVASEPDLIAFEALVRLVAVMRGGEASAANYARLQSFLGEFGMTPASRSRVAQSKGSAKLTGFAALKAT